MTPFDAPGKQAFHNEQFLLFPQCFLPAWITFCHFRQISLLKIHNYYPKQNDKNLDWPKFKALAGNNINVSEKLKLFLRRVENIVGKGENAGCQHFLLFPQCFQRTSTLRSLKLGLCGKWFIDRVKISSLLLPRLS